MSERQACRVVKQPRGTQRYRPTQRDDEDTLTQAIVTLASQYGRYGYRRITALLKRAGWKVGKDRVERIWRREGLKVPKKQKPRGRLWLNDGSCVRLRPQHARVPEWRDLLLVEGSAGAGRTLAGSLQHHPSTLCARLQIASTRDVATRSENRVWRSGKQSTLSTSPHPRRRRDTYKNQCATLTIQPVQKIGHFIPQTHDFLTDLPESGAVSTGRCNTCVKFTSRSFKAQSLSRSLIEAQGYLVEIGLRIAGQVGLLG